MLIRTPYEENLVYSEKKHFIKTLHFFYYWQRKINYSTMTHTLQRRRRLSTGTADASNIYEASVVCVRERSGRIWELIKKKKKKNQADSRSDCTERDLRCRIQPYWSAPLWQLLGTSGALCPGNWQPKVMSCVWACVCEVKVRLRSWQALQDGLLCSILL